MCLVFFFPLFLRVFFKLIPVQKFTHLKLQKFQFIFGSLPSLYPRTDGISLQQWEDGETRIQNKYFLTGSFLSTLLVFSSAGAAHCLLPHDRQELCLPSNQVRAHEYILFYSQKRIWAWQVNRISVYTHTRVHIHTELMPMHTEVFGEWGPGELSSPSRPKIFGKLLMQPCRETSPHQYIKRR